MLLSNWILIVQLLNDQISFPVLDKISGRLYIQSQIYIKNDTIKNIKSL
ncbi:hypothetical protein SAMN05421841_1734 [Chryseobacterium wanjuense]|uniref:Uncharacterized protein n=1 Tax=Chryseobacterium wanjuense TaxID=356305 RepID=A0A1I0Q8A4_9FLAO|nr:hypothetical protein SAMN05421841_1734 [Chryseobacterium wanjuense]